MALPAQAKGIRLPQTVCAPLASNLRPARVLPAILAGMLSPVPSPRGHKYKDHQHTGSWVQGLSRPQTPNHSLGLLIQQEQREGPASQTSFGCWGKYIEVGESEAAYGHAPPSPLEQSPDLREGRHTGQGEETGLAGEDGHSGLGERATAQAWACGKGLGSTAPEVNRLGHLPAPAANVRTLGGRAHSAEESDQQSRGRKGELSTIFTAVHCASGPVLGPGGALGPLSPGPGAGKGKTRSTCQSFLLFSSISLGNKAGHLPLAFRF